MKRIILILGLIALAFIITGCEEVTLYDNIGIEVAEYAKLPAGIKEASERGEYRFVTLRISGTPSDHFYGIDALGLINIIDSDNKWCYPQGSPLQGSLDDVLVKETVYLSFLAFCENKEAKSSTFIFYKTPSGPAQDLGKTFNVDLSTVAGKKDIAISESMSAEGLELVKKYAEEEKENKEAMKLAAEKAAQEQAAREQRNKQLKELSDQFEIKYNDCKTTNGAMELCMQEAQEMTIEEATGFCNLAGARNTYCGMMVVRELFSTSEDCKEAISNTYWGHCDFAFE